MMMMYDKVFAGCALWFCVTLQQGSPWKASASIPEQQQQQSGSGSRWRMGKSGGSSESIKGPRSASTPEELTKVGAQYINFSFGGVGGE